MPDNLTISIGADTSKLRADLAVAKEEIRKLNTEIRAAAQEFQKTGDRSRLDALTRELDRTTRSAAALNREIRATNQAVASPAWAAGARGVRAMADEFTTLARAAVPIAGIAGGFLELANLIGKTKDQLLALNRMSLTTGFSPTAIKAFNETLEDTGSEAGAGDRSLMGLARSMAEVRQQARNAGEAIGGNVRVLRGALGAEKEFEAGQQRIRDLLSGVNVARGGLINKVEIKDAATAFAVLQVNMAKFKDTTEGNDAALQAIIDGFTRLEKTGKTDLGNLVAQNLGLGRSMREALPALKELGTEAGGLQKKMDELRAQNRDPNAAAIQQAKDYQRELRNIGDEYDKLGFAFLRAFGPTIQSEMRLLADEIRVAGDVLRDLQSIVNGTWNWPQPPAWLMSFLGAKPIESADVVGPGGEGLAVPPGLPSEDRLGIQQAINKTIEAVPGLMKRFQDKYVEALKQTQQQSDNIFTQIARSISDIMGKSSIWDRFISGAKSAFDAAKSFFTGIGDAVSTVFSNLPKVVRGGQTESFSGPPAPFEQGGVRVLKGYASGGLMSGPGTATSDSILARLSAGEFVVNAAATSRFLPLLRMINDGMRQPLMPRTRFATGGLVVADGPSGTPVHLHIGGHSFALSGPDNVVNALLNEARQQHVRSAGVKPSWYGGR